MAMMILKRKAKVITEVVTDGHRPCVMAMMKWSERILAEKVRKAMTVG
jgi:hypothetical protein